MPLSPSIQPLIPAADTIATELPIDHILRDALQSIRAHLGMDVAFISEFVDGRRYFRYVDSGPLPARIQVGDSDPLEETYCQLVAAGQLPQLIPDASEDARARTLPVTSAFPVGAHVSVPIVFSDGRVYGTFCCFRTTADHTLRERDRALVQVFAEFTGKQLERQMIALHEHQEMVARVQSVIDQRQVTAVYQPIYHVEKDGIVGFEALSRFSALPIRPPNIWFNEATQTGRVIELEELALTQAIAGLAALPAELYISLNVSPETIIGGMIARLLQDVPLDRIVLEITEHVAISDYAKIADVLAPLRRSGLRLAVDDAGAGYASLRHILHIAPDIIKLDISIIRNIDTERSHRALTAALVRFAEEIGSRIIAEGVETTAELATLRQLRVEKAQGYLIGRPMPLADAAHIALARRHKGA